MLDITTRLELKITGLKLNMKYVYVCDLYDRSILLTKFQQPRAFKLKEN